MKCPKCGNEAQADAIFCDQCGQRLAPLASPASADQPVTVAEPVAEEGVCAKCGARNTPGEAFCGECGAPLEPPQPSAAGAPSPAAATSAAAQALCPACGARLEPGDAYCFACGAALGGGTPLGGETPLGGAPQGIAATGSETVIPLGEPAQASAPQPVAAPSAADECPNCGARVKPGDAFCDFCGAALRRAAPARGGPRLLVGGTNDEIALPEGAEVLLGREDPVASVFPDVDLTPYGAEEAGVSRRHCKITLAEGQYAIQDLGSTNGTLVNRARVQPGVPTALHDGDEIRVGRLRLIFRTGA